MTTITGVCASFRIPILKEAVSFLPPSRVRHGQLIVFHAGTPGQAEISAVLEERAPQLPSGATSANVLTFTSTSVEALDLTYSSFFIPNDGLPA